MILKNLSLKTKLQMIISKLLCSTQKISKSWLDLNTLPTSYSHQLFVFNYPIHKMTNFVLYGFLNDVGNF